MSDHPLGTPNPPVNGTIPDTPSIVDQILNLDQLLSADVRRAEKTARICTRPDLEARFDDLNAELATLVDDRGQPLEADEALVETGRTAWAVAREIRAVQAEMAASMRSVRMRQLPEDDWRAFLKRHEKVLADAGGLLPEAVYGELITDCAVAPTMTADQVAALRRQLGAPAVDELATTAWTVNTRAGVSVPKSPLSLAVLRRQTRSPS